MSDMTEDIRLVRNIKWASADRDNMEFTARASCYQREALDRLLAASRQPVVKPLEWHPYSLKHEYGSGSWEAYGIHGTYDILDVGTDPKNGLRYYLRGIKQFDTLDEAKAAAQADYTQRILSALTKPEDSQ